MPKGDVIQIVMLGIMRRPLTEWLRGQGLDLVEMPPSEAIPHPKPTDLPTYIVIPGENNPLLEALLLLRNGGPDAPEEDSPTTAYP